VWKSAAYARVFEGGFRKCGVQRWFFCGEFVVDCVVFAVTLMVIFLAIRKCQLSQKYF
jgi:hypothetical protein